VAAGAPFDQREARRSGKRAALPRYRRVEAPSAARVAGLAETGRGQAEEARTEAERLRAEAEAEREAAQHQREIAEEMRHTERAGRVPRGNGGS
jgi:hypothetical protein